ncbi:MAG: hypothetical protein JSS00_07350, partial [Proteobacteria bacterium]|nr:hypothetical protein [Pseudomonadota bacterium]
MRHRTHFRSALVAPWCALAALTSGLAGEPAAADTVAMAEAPLVSPSAAWTYFNGLTLTSSARSADPLITRTAHALGDDVDRIYAFVHDTIEVAPRFGVQKGARGALIDRSGTAFDQAQLFAELVRAAQPTWAVTYQLGTITLTHDQVLSWLGADNAAAVTAILANGGIPADISSTGGTITSVTMMHLWVAVAIPNASCSPCMFDPAFKSHIARSGALTPTTMDSATGFSASSLMSTALSTATTSTSGAPQVSHINRSGIRSSLQTYSSNLLTTVRNAYANSELADVIGGRDIVAASSAPVRQSSLPYQASLLTSFANDVPLALRTQITITIGANLETHAWALDEIYGDELALVPNVIEPLPSQGPATFHFERNEQDLSATEHNGVDVGLAVAINHPYAANPAGGTPNGGY